MKTTNGLMLAIYLFTSYLVYGDVLGNNSNETMFADNNTYNLNIESTNTTILENVLNNTEESNILYVYPEKINVTQDFQNRSERKLLYKYGEDVMLIFPSPLDTMNSTISDNESNIINNTTAVNITNSTSNIENINNDLLVTLQKTSSEILIKTENQNKPSDSDAEHPHSSLRERLSSLSKLRYKKRNHGRTKLKKKIIKTYYSNKEKNNTSHVLYNNKEKINSSHVLFDDIASKFTKEKKDFLHQNKSSQLIPSTNNTSVSLLTLKSDISFGNNFSISLNDSGIVNTLLEETRILNTSENTGKKNVESNNIANSNSTNNENDFKNRYFHVDMIPFTLEDAMVPSASEIQNYWTQPDMEETANVGKLRDMIKNKIIDTHKNLKKKQLLKHKKIKLTNNERKKYLNCGTDDLKKFSVRKQTNKIENGYITTKCKDYQIPKNIPDVQQKSAFTDEDLKPTNVVWDYLQKGMNNKNLQSYIPIPEFTPPTANGLLIIGPIPKSLHPQYKYEPYKNQIQLPII